MPILIRCNKCKAQYRVRDDQAGHAVECTACRTWMLVPPRKVSSGGSTIFRHPEIHRPPEPTSGHHSSILEITRHIEKHVGTVDGVLHDNPFGIGRSPTQSCG